MFAVLEFSDFLWIFVIVSSFSGGSAAYSYFKASDASRIRRLEAKMDLVLKHFGLEYKDPTPSQRRLGPGSIVLGDLEMDELDEESRDS